MYIMASMSHMYLIYHALYVYEEAEGVAYESDLGMRRRVGSRLS